MKPIIHFQTNSILAGTTLKNEHETDSNNMALHVTEEHEKVIQNRKNLAGFLSCSIEDFVVSEQTHSCNVKKITKAEKGRGATKMDSAIKNTDAMYTNESGIVLCTFTADCVPVTFYDKETNLIGVIHSGWQGTIKEITLNVFNRIIEKENSNPENIYVHLGSALSQQKFEVDEDVYKKYHQLGYADDFIYFNQDTGKYHIDNQKTVQKQCEIIGIPHDHITTDHTCTYQSPEHFSYREDKKAGRHLSFITRVAN